MVGRMLTRPAAQSRKTYYLVVYVLPPPSPLAWGSLFSTRTALPDLTPIDLSGCKVSFTMQSRRRSEVGWTMLMDCGSGAAIADAFER